MSLLHAFILGIIEGLTEFLPISSTGHMIIVSHFLSIKESVTLTTFEIVVQLGAILAVVVTYFKKLFNLETIKKLIIAFIPTGAVGFLVFPHIKYLLTNPLLVAFTLILGGIMILFAERNVKQKEVNEEVSIASLSYKNAFILGLFQSLAIIPGVSRSGAVIVGGLLKKLPRTLLVEFTFLLAVPTMSAATLYTLLKKHKELSLDALAPIALGSVVAFIVSLFVIKFALSYIRKHSFSVFGWYRIVAGLLLAFILLY